MHAWVSGLMGVRAHMHQSFACLFLYAAAGYWNQDEDAVDCGGHCDPCSKTHKGLYVAGLGKDGYNWYRQPKDCTKLPGFQAVSDYYECSDAAKSLNLARVTNLDSPNRVYKSSKPIYCYLDPLEKDGKQLSFNHYGNNYNTPKTWVGQICANKALHRETCSDGTLGCNERMIAQVRISRT